MYKVREYSEKAESSILISEHESLNDAKKKANEIGINGEVWGENDELCIYAVRVSSAASQMGKKGGSSRTPKKSASSAANLDRARAEGKKGGYPKNRPRKAKNLNELYEMMKSNHPATLDVHGQWSSSLPTFGGIEPSDTREVWSWDETRLIVGHSCDDLKIISREEWIK